MFLLNYLQTFGNYLVLMWRAIAVPDKMRMFGKQYVKEMA
jgi:phospholipid/cholesterol/gamma-HCH transport system permease protein